jgi:hypothetical protein
MARGRSGPPDRSVVEYTIRYAYNRGLKPSFPSLVVGTMQEVGGWPVRNADGGANIAHFHTVDDAESAITKARRAYKKEFGVDWFALPGGELPPGTRTG